MMTTFGAFLLVVSFIACIFTVAGGSIMKNVGMDPGVQYELSDTRRDLANYIYPGTKWCGKGDAAESEDDLGLYEEEDKCCRQHDHCERYIESFRTGFNTFNPFPYTLSDCNCDEEFLNCLKGLDTTVGRDIGQIYFSELQVPCLNFDLEDVCAEKGFLGLSCLRTKKELKANFDNSFSGAF
ncbi:phospholipase A2 isozymes PA3A/PA3B/PA5-like [Saccoglossus kowalevskii]|uniref:Phospholipase A2 isozymes PA3A/PA3B/PA5-like n=1 Tax=Saccoglossus kowalevskii TaxID=10224 RepID=A0ABM0GMB7_SACKO|nr:PREDICTED: phospholipase A2 isozymes PA3A/PA3B/PA5-like [Saccoglossus kowalevskii]